MNEAPLAGAIDLLERVGERRFPLSTLGEVADPRAIEVLRRAGILVDAEPAETLPCPHRASCVRELRASTEGGRATFLALCGREPEECDPEPIDAHRLATARFVPDAMVLLLRRLFAIRKTPPTAARPGEPFCLGVEETLTAGVEPRDVFLSLTPSTDLSPSWLALRERSPRRALVYVPTSRRLGGDLLALHGPHDRVHLVALDEVLTIREGILARALTPPALHVVKNDVVAAPKPLRKTRGLSLPKITAWRDLRVCIVDGETLRFDGAGTYARASFQDLGFASTKNRAPLRHWHVLTRTCEANGIFDWKAFDRRWEVARRHVSNCGLRLQALFGLEDRPFEEVKDGIYRSRFRARESLPDEGMG